MAAILPAVHIEAADKVAGYFLPYQLAWIHDTSRMMLAEKSVRIGWTYADAFRNVTRRILAPKRDYLFQTKDQQSSIEYLETCMKFAEVFNFTKSIVSHGVETMKVPSVDSEGRKFTDEVKFGVIKFDNKSRILAFSSNPFAMAVFEGDVGLDEFAKHQQAAKVWETAQGRITWGFNIGVWSAHDGSDTLFYEFANEARAGKGGWSHYRVTLEDAVQMGLVEKVNEARGTSFTREQFIADAKNRARLPEIYEQAYNCNPQGSTSAIVAWSSIELCQKEYTIPRLHFEAAQIVSTFGKFDPATARQRETRIISFLCSIYGEAFLSRAHHSLGFDIAASGEGDLCCVYIDEKRQTERQLRALFTCRTDDWNFIKTAVSCFMQRLPSVNGSGDETGLGRQICWELKQQFSGRFEGVNFSREKHDMGFALMNQLATGEKQFPKNQRDVAQDFFALRKIYQGGRWIFTESRNALNAASHCDIAWAGALSSNAAMRKTGGAMSATSTQASGNRGMFGGRGHQPISGGRLAGV